MSKWKCTHCGADPYETGCGDPDRGEEGETVACPLDYKSWWRRLLYRMGRIT